MKRVVIGLTISAAVLGGFIIAQPMTDSSAAQTENKKMITEKEAKEIALQKVNGTITEADYDRDELRPHYEFEIQSNNEEVNIEVDAETGKATITERKTIAANNNASSQSNATASAAQDKNNGNAASSQQAAAKPSTATQQEASKNTTNTAGNQTNTAASQKAVISKAEALKIASTVAKGTVTKVELDSDQDDRTKTYELEFKDGLTEYDVEIDAYTGKILEVNQDIED